jgi:hypothetical protein
MTIGSFDVALLTLAFIVPGFIADSVVGLAVARKLTPETTLLRYLTLTCYNYALCSWLIYLMVRGRFFPSHPGAAAIGWVFVFLVSPILLGIATAKLRQGTLISKLMTRVGLSAIRPNPTAWDECFVRGQPAMILVTMKDGFTVAGKFANRSAASSDPSDRDLFIEEVWRTGEGDAPWTAVPDSGGIWIRGDQIQHIQFWPLAYIEPEPQSSP